jgi:ParB-like chromosome segregation protein Spo0J
MAENHRQRIDEEHVTRSEIAERLAGLRSEVARGEARLRQLDEERVG